MAFVAPAGYAPSAMETSPRSKSTSTFNPLAPSPHIGKDSTMEFGNAVAGPSGYSSNGGSSRRTSKDEQPLGPSSAPPNPSVISVTHPPEFIHTHHPRRGSLTPLGLNVITPHPPVQMTWGSTHPPHSPVRSVGFTPTQAYQDAFPTSHGRRGSGASSSSTLTLSRPPQFAPSGGYNRERRRSSLAPAYPAGFNPERRRSSLTPANPAPASPTRTHANGVISRPGSSGDAPGGSALHGRHHTTHGPRPLSSVRQQQQQQYAAAETRRGSMPQLHYGGWTGPRWNPSLPPQRGSVGEEALPDDSYRFGSISSQHTQPAAAAQPATPASAALRAIEISPSRRASKVKMDAFQEAEAAEAERQRRAFLSATYGEDGRRARERLSIGGPGAGAVNTPSSPLGRRPSLMLWEKLGMAAAAKVVEPELAASSAPTLILPKAMSEDEYGPRRGSLPIAIPQSSLGRTPSSRHQSQLDDASPLNDSDERLGESFGEDDGDYDDDKLAPIRPAPPLLPLSDPGPRLLPSTLALQRASHLLNSRRLQADPLPHPLPPSLHPPVPVDVTEFDIDFILAGSQAQLGRSKRSSTAQTGPNAPVDVIAPFAAASAPTPTLKLGGDDEDSFAKFVGKFDDEYGGRRGEWTFRAKGPPSTAGTEGPRALWESPGAGAFELFANGDVRSGKTGATWRVSRKGICEYEIQSVTRDVGFFDRLNPLSTIHERYVLATKSVHCEHGGVKIAASTDTSPTGDLSISSARQSIERERERSKPIKDRLRVSISEATRAVRLDSTDSNATATNYKLSSSLPSASTSTPKKKRRGSKDEEGSRLDALPKLLRARSRDPDRDREKTDDDKHKKDKDKDKDKSHGFFKKGLMASFKNSTFIAQYEEKKAQREERERERQQAHSWGGSASHAGFIHPSGKNTPPAVTSPTAAYSSPSQPHAERSGSTQTTATVASSTRTSLSDDRRPMVMSPCAEVDSRNASGSYLGQWREGKAWVEVPDDAVAMVIPADDADLGHEATEALGSPSAASVDVRQALLVWYVPFNGDKDDRDRQASSSSLNRAAVSADSHTPTPTGGSPSSSLPKFQKLLRRRTSKDKELSRNSSQRSSDVDQPTTKLPPKHPLPFRSFRVVARLVDVDDLKSVSDHPDRDRDAGRHAKQPQSAITPSSSVPPPAPSRPAALSVDSGIKLRPPPLNSVKTDESSMTAATGAGSSSLGGASVSTAPTSTILAGRTISTVIAVCHSRTQGVEFVLEGLDRLGYCYGESAWGPTGYEEWRGSGLSDKGRELVELLWAGCTGVMGLVT